MLIEYYTIRIKDAEPGKGLLHSTQHYDEVRSSIKHFKEKHPGKKIVAYKHVIKKGPQGVGHKRQVMFGEGVWIHPSHQKELDDPSVSTTRKKEIKAKYAEKSKIDDDGGEWHDKQKQRGNINSVNRYFAKHNTNESTRSFKTLMRSIEDKKSIKNLKVPSPSERHADGSMKQKDDGDAPFNYDEWKNQPAKKRALNSFGKDSKFKGTFKEDLDESAQVTNKHKVMVTISDPNHNMVSKRKEQILRKINVTATGRDEAEAKAEAHYKKQGYKIHDVEYHSPVKESLDEAVVHTVKHNDDVYTIHQEGSLRGNSYHIKRNDTKIAGKHASINNAKGYLNAIIASKKTNESIDEGFVQDAHDAKMAELKTKGYKHHGLGPETGVGVESHIMVHPDTKEKIHIKTWKKSNSEHGQKVESIKEDRTMKTYKDLSEATFRVDHEGHPDAATNKELGHLKPGKTYTNHVTKYEDSARKTVKMLKDKGFVGVKAYKNGKLMEEVESIDEGKMSELSADIGQHMDKHITNYKKIGGGESLMSHAAKASGKIAKLHGIEHKHAEKFVSDYIDSKLNEEIIGGLIGLALGAKGAYNAAKKTPFSGKGSGAKNYIKNFAKGIVDPRTYVPSKKVKEETKLDEGYSIELNGESHPTHRVPIEHYDEFKKKNPGSTVRFRGPRKGKWHTLKADATHFSIVNPGKTSGHFG